jgi:hypothetical protein
MRLTGGNATSAVPVGIVGTSAVAGAVPEGTATPCVVATCAGAWITPTIGAVSVLGTRSSSDLEKPYATSAAAATTPTVTAIIVVRDRRLDSVVSTTRPTLPR